MVAISSDGDFYGKRPAGSGQFPQRVTETDLEEIIERASRRVPKLRMLSHAAGPVIHTPDARPLRASSRRRRAYICAGFSGMGFKISPAIGLVMSELILDGAAATVDISAFRPTRFAEGTDQGGV